MCKAVTIGITLSLLVISTTCQDTNSDSDKRILTGYENGTSSPVICKPYNPPVPDFSLPVRRLSMTKCYEYMWGIKVRHERAKRDNIRTECIPATQDNKIIGGSNATPAEFPHMGAVGWQTLDKKQPWKFQCGSTLVSSKFALTAAHCTSGDPRDTTIADVNPKIIRFGVEDVQVMRWDRLPIDRFIASTIVHPKYDPPRKYFDLALFELNRKITFDYFVKPACLWNGDITSVKDTTISGWGVTVEGSRQTSPLLKFADIKMVDYSTCDSILRPYYNRRWYGLQDHQFCAGNMQGGIDTCQGDSGGPLQMRIPLPAEIKESIHFVIGVTSFGFGCGRPNMPGVYTNVLHFLDWIENIVWD